MWRWARLTVLRLLLTGPIVVKRTNVVACPKEEAPPRGSTLIPRVYPWNPLESPGARDHPVTS